MQLVGINDVLDVLVGFPVRKLDAKPLRTFSLGALREGRLNDRKVDHGIRSLGCM
jgi:hypothetical protein